MTPSLGVENSNRLFPPPVLFRSEEEVSIDVDDIFDKLSFDYFQRFTSQWQDSDAYIFMRKAWTLLCMRFSRAVIRESFFRWEKPMENDKFDNSWPPTPVDIRNLCHQSHEYREERKKRASSSSSNLLSEEQSIQSAIELFKERGVWHPEYNTPQSVKDTIKNI